MPAARSPWRRPLWWGVVLIVLLLHWVLGEHLAEIGLGDSAAPPPPAPMDVAFVHELALATPPVVAPKIRPILPVATAPAASAAASAPAKSASQTAQAQKIARAASAAEAVPSVPAGAQAGAQASAPASAQAGAPTSSAPVALAASAALAQAGASVSLPASAPASGPVLAQLNITPVASAPSAVAAAPVAFDWPPSTRLDYDLIGNFRGPLYGSARVEWRRQAERYQVQVTVKVNPVFERRMISNGVLGATGLMPRRFDQETDVPLRATKRETVLLGPEGISLANGHSADSPSGVQDSASQFVQMTWLFLTHPERMHVGALVQFPLALPRRVGVWTYEVVEQVKLDLPFGAVDTFHLKPRLSGTKPNELSVEMWMAPALQYLPVRLRIQQDEETHLELTLKKPPVQAASSQ